jgi:hypothetical protein
MSIDIPASSIDNYVTDRDQGPYSQHFIFFLTYELVQ